MRTRIVRLTVLVATVSIAVFGVPLAVAASHYLIGEKYRELERIADAAAIAVSGDLTAAPSLDPGSDPALHIAVYDRTGALLAGDGPGTPGALTAQALTGTADTGTADGRIGAAAPVTDGDEVVGAVLVTAPDGSVVMSIGLTWLAMLLLAGAALLIAWLVARRAARRLAAPLQELSAAAQRLGAGDFSVHTRPAGIAEIDSVSDSVNRTAAQLGSMVERERAFTADASHQLRTPLTGLRLELEAALDNPAIDPRAALSGALGAAERLQSTVDELLALARTHPVVQQLDADVILGQVRHRWHAVLAAQGRPLRLEILGHPTPRGSSAAVTQIIDVLIDNALRHGAGEITVAIRELDGAAAIDVTDQGLGVAAGSTVFDRQVGTDETGHGRGLPLARRLAHAQGGRLLVSHPAPPTFSLLLPAAQSDPPSGESGRAVRGR